MNDINPAIYIYMALLLPLCIRKYYIITKLQIFSRLQEKREFIPNENDRLTPENKFFRLYF